MLEGNQRSEHVISVYSKKNNQEMKNIRHISDTLTNVVDGLMSDLKVSEEHGTTWKVSQYEPEITPYLDTFHATWVSGGGVEIPYISMIFCMLQRYIK